MATTPAEAVEPELHLRGLRVEDALGDALFGDFRQVQPGAEVRAFAADHGHADVGRQVAQFALGQAKFETDNNQRGGEDEGEG